MATRDEPEERILDAALARIMQVGIRRASLDDIARRARLNRVTIYRRFRTKENLIDAVLRREIERALAEATAIVAATEGIDARIEIAVLYVLRQTRTHPLVTRLLDVAPDEAVTFYTVRGEELVRLGIGYIVGLLRATQELGLIDRYDPEPVAELVARLAHSVLMTPAGGVNFEDDTQLRAFVTAAIVPMVKHGIGAPSQQSSDRTRQRA